MTIKVTITSWRVPFDQIVHGTHEFEDEQSALKFINAMSKAWWDDNNGASDEEAEDYEPIERLAYDHARYELWGGENGFHAMLDQESYDRLLDAHYKREWDDKGMKRPGYLRAAMGEDVSKEIEEVFDWYQGNECT